MFLIGAAVCGLSSPALAGPGAVLHACFKFQVTPTHQTSSDKLDFSFDFNATVQGTCIKTDSSPAFSTTVDFTSEPNPETDKSTPDDLVHCGTLGYYEANNSSCTVTLGYHTTGGNANYSDSIDLTWWSGDTNNHISGGKGQSTTVVCGSSDVCQGQEYNWETGSVGQAYVIFQPSGS